MSWPVRPLSVNISETTAPLEVKHGIRVTINDQTKTMFDTVLNMADISQSFLLLWFLLHMKFKFFTTWYLDVMYISS